jgi:truncated hemoglobin YjbI
MSAMGAAISQEQIDELVEKFYVLLLQDQYYVDMFATRQVDVELLKQRQKVFIARLAGGGGAETGRDDSAAQVEERHRFDISPEQAEAWLGKWRECMAGMAGLDPAAKELLLGKITVLAHKLTANKKPSS